MDQDTRNKLQRATQQVRRILEEEFAKQLEGTFDVLPNGKILPEPGKHLDARQRLIRQKLVDAIEHIKAGGKTPREAVNEYTREAAFTFLNRFVALRMVEAREILQECVSQGDASSGYKEFCGLAPGLGSLDDGGYRLYLECLFDELSVDVKVLFNRRDAASLLWPRRTALKQLLEVIARPELSNIWAEDETIGWVYQYYNDPAERKAMRDASAVPRNSRELAVRNQFFTPRYVVEFLTDNTLGRIWYEMTKGETRLTEQCRYLVRRPTEVFLEEGEEAPTADETDANETLSQEDLVKQPVHITHRPVKDPREIRLLDPACGSMHFGLYAFDLFEAIYEESWDRDFCPALQEAYPEKADYLRDVPRLIIEHNIHGVDIDPRAVQIAGLSLWLRAQTTWKDTPASVRPPVRRSNIVCAEPMPGSDAMLEDFVQTLDPPLLGELVQTVFDKMQLAGEAGTLLKIEEETRTAIDEARDEAQRQRGDLFERAKATDEDFFGTAEERIYAALRDYAESAEAGDYQRRLFAEDAAHGFAFIDLCRKRYDAVVMNPPFGDPTQGLKDYISEQYPSSSADIYTAFVDRCIHASTQVGVLSNRTFLTLGAHTKFRKTCLFSEGRLELVADLGSGVLDAMVEVSAYVISRESQAHRDCSAFFPVHAAHEKDRELLSQLTEWGEGATVRSLDEFARLPNSSLAYWLPDALLKHFNTTVKIEGGAAHVRVGLQTSNDFRFARLKWEVPVDETGPELNWALFAKGGEFSPFYDDIHLVVKCVDNFSENVAFTNARYPYLNGNARSLLHADTANFFSPGLTYPWRTSLGFAPRVLPSGCIFAAQGSALLPLESSVNKTQDLLSILGVLNSSLYQEFISIGVGAVDGAARSYQIGLVQSLPWLREINADRRSILARITFDCVNSRRAFDQIDEVTFLYSFSNRLQNPTLSSVCDEIRDTLGAETMSMLNSFEALDSEVLELFGVDGVTVSASTALKSSLESRIPSNAQLAASLLSHCVGAILGRWDIRYATGERQPPELPAPFDPLPVCPPDMLQNADGLPAAPSEVPDEYPLPITWPGILVDDEGHAEDIVARVEDALTVIWGDRSAAIEQEACEILGVRTLRDYFQSKKGFFPDHIKRYSKSRRKAPIYWQLATPSGSYSVWLYYHRFTKDTFFSVVEPVQDKLKHERQKLSRLQGEAGADPTASQRKAIESQEKFVAELASIAEEVDRVAPLWNPNLNDGVIINFAPLWRLVPQNNSWQKECKKIWDKLAQGEYDWAHLAMHLWPERVVPKCVTDASLAIAHGLQDIFWEQDDRDRFQPKEKPQGGWEPVVKELVAERTSPAVKAALERLLTAPAPAGNSKSRRRKATT